MLNFQKMQNILILKIGISQNYWSFFFFFKASGSSFQKYENVATLDIISVKEPTPSPLLFSHFYIAGIFVNDVYASSKRKKKKKTTFVASTLSDAV